MILGLDQRRGVAVTATAGQPFHCDSVEIFVDMLDKREDMSPAKWATQGGPSRTWDISGIRNADWFITLFADGHQSAADPDNPDIVYSEWQQGNLVRWDRKTGEIIYIQPQPGPDEESDRFNWDAPILISPHDPKTIFYASQ